MRAHSVRFAAALQALLLMASLLVPALAAATEIYTDLWIYQDGDTVTVTGIDFGANEVVDLVSTDPEAVVVDTGSATTDAAGGFVYQFVLHATITGIYDIVATGRTSGLTATTQFDPPQLAITGEDPAANARQWFRLGSVPGGFDLTVAGTYLCTTNCTSATNVVVELFNRNAANNTVGTPITLASPASTQRTLAPLTGGTWSTTYQFRSAPSGAQLPLPAADGLYEARAIFNFVRTPGSTVDALTNISDDHFGYDNVAPTIVGALSPLAPASPPWYNASQSAVSLNWTCGDALSGVGTIAPSLCPGGVSVPNGSNQSFSASVQDRAGNSASATVSNIYVDRANPTISNAILPASPAASGWYNASTGAPTVTFTCGDTGSSGLASCTSPVLVGQGEDQSIVGTATDNAANSATSTRSNVDVDTVAPSSTINAPTVGATGITVTGTVSDATSGGDEITIQLYAGPCFSGSPIDTDTVNVGGGPGNWSATLTGGGYNTPGTFCILRTPVDNAGNPGSTNGFEYVADAAPSVILTSPLNGALNVPVGSNIVVTFSEAVTVDLAPHWFTIQCGATAYPGLTSGSGTNTVTFNPAIDLAQSTLCTVTIAGASVHDTDANDPPDTFTPNYVFSFTTASANTAPVLTVPAPITVEATSSSGAAVNFNVTAVDAEDEPDPTPTCDWNSGDTFPIGTTTVNCSVTDSGGLGDSDSFTVTVSDSTDPIVLITSPEDAAPNGWHNIATNDAFAGVTVNVAVSDAVGATTLTCTNNGDPIAGPLDPTGDSFPLGDGIHVINCVATDAAGNSGSDERTFQVDQTAPTISAAVTPDAALTGWWNIATGAPTVTYTCSDAGSGLAACADPWTFGEGANQVDIGQAHDVAGNTSTTSVSNIDVDLTAPSIDASLNPAGPAASGWYNIATGAPTVSYDCSDATSGIASCTAPHLFGEGADQSHTGTAVDNAGNQATDGVSDIDVDTVAPGITSSVTPPASITGWWNIATGAPTVSYDCSDATSGIASCTAPHLFGEGADQGHTGTAVDNAGNSDTASVSNIDVDLTAPTISAAVTPDADATSGWWNIATGAPTVAYTCGDALSGVASCTGDHTFVEGADQTHTGTAIDLAGNSKMASVSNIDVDLTAPSITFDSRLPAANGFGWNNEAVTVTWACADGTSGAVEASVSDTKSAEGADQVANGTCDDNAGNSSSATYTNIDIDLTDPNVALVGGPANGASYYFGFVPPAPTCTASDALSGLNGACAVTGYGTTVGTHTVTATAHDKAGNTNTDSRTYTVLAWTLTGFYSPVDMNGIVNTVKSGSTVPLKFEVFAGSTELITTAAIGADFKTRQVSCADFGDIGADDIEVTTTGGTTFRYDSTSGQFIQNWQTPKNRAGTCWVVTMTTDDGSFLAASFKLK